MLQAFCRLSCNAFSVLRTDTFESTGFGKQYYPLNLSFHGDSFLFHPSRSVP